MVFFVTDSICIKKKLDTDSTKLEDFPFDNEANDVVVFAEWILSV